jgi:predicted XRE-type DNA-binding protein
VPPIVFDEVVFIMRRRKSPNITPEMAAHIRFLVMEKKLFQHQAAALLDVNQGRVCEVMKGIRHPGILPKQGPFPV